MKTKFLAVLVSTTLLSACNDSGLSGEPTLAETIIDFNLDPNNLAPVSPSFLSVDTKDGTIASDGFVGTDSYSTDISDPSIALGKSDGWGTSAPFIINFKGSNLDAASASQGFHIMESGNPTSADFSTSSRRMLEVNEDYEATSLNNTLIIRFKKPLNPTSDYMFAITNDLKDINGNGVDASSTYFVLKGSIPVPVGSEALIPAKNITQLVEQEFSKEGIESSKIVFSTWFTTQSTGKTLQATKGAIASGVGNFDAIWKDSANPNSVDLSQAYLMTVPASGEDYAAAIQADTNFATYIDVNGTATPGLVNAYAANTVTVTKGTVKLPYFLEKGATDWNTTPFESAMPSLAIISNALGSSENASTVTQQLVAAGIDPTKLASDTSEQLKLVGLDLNDANGSPLDSERVITRYNPIPKIKALDDVPFILFTPTSTLTSDEMEIVIYQHGITSVKESAYAFAANIINGSKGLGKDIAILAIDQPIHGDRSLDATRSANVDPTNYLNLAYLPVGRDNLRQSILDNVGLRAAVTISQGANLFAGTPLATLANTATTNPALFGHSLGGITGFGTVVAANNTLSDAAGDSLFKFSKIAAANTGGQIVDLLIGSESFGPLVVSQVTAGVPEDQQAATINLFAFAAQTVIDTVDPINLVNIDDSNSSNVLAGLPIYMQQVKNDDTVPNSVTEKPLAGTIPLATSLGLAVVDSASQATSNGRNFTKFSDVGQHSSVIAPQDANLADLGHTTEMQSQLVQFLSGVAEDYSVADTSVLE
ncbi:VolA/Pla-1 family phospholipase [Enterovibrio norvegicus]|uniref:VolA/Pla-1 family phospholipase n=1 Tax=Enterovibrio norvegicus TaxID=188144 RepID=UPI000C85284E|nr:VolA/Pla-1 family phospholipase [Enterovibrio norvegicus]PMH64375.1 lipase [Enterovibrio norvegicus]